jgi:hypothetical protein
MHLGTVGVQAIYPAADWRAQGGLACVYHAPQLEALEDYSSMCMYELPWIKSAIFAFTQFQVIIVTPSES